MDTPIKTGSFTEDFARWLKPEPFHALARQTGFVRRQGKIDPHGFLFSAVLGQASALLLTLNSQAQSLAVPVSRQAIHQRYTPKAVAFFRAAHAHVLAEALGQPPIRSQAEGLGQHFNAVYLLDSTGFDAPASLQILFPSCGGDGSPANVKVLLRYEYIRGQFEPRALLPGKKSDQGLAAAAAALLQKDQLQIQDKGFYDAAGWHTAQAAGAYLLMPWARSVTVWTRPQPGQPERLLDVAAALGASADTRVEWAEVTLGKAKRRVEGLRLVAFRLSPESAARHREGLRKAQRTQGRTPSQTALELAGWLILVTNAPLAKLPNPMIAYLYRLRWQVELIFRQCKSTLRLDQARGDNPHRTQCEIWARLMAAVFVFAWHAHTNAACWGRYHMEISFEKVARLFQLKAHTLSLALLKGSPNLAQTLQEFWRTLLATTRKGRQKTRTNSWDSLNDLWLDPRPTPPPSPSMPSLNH